jgi:hypothetical protein
LAKDAHGYFLTIIRESKSKQPDTDMSIRFFNLPHLAESLK